MLHKVTRLVFSEKRETNVFISHTIAYLLKENLYVVEIIINKKMQNIFRIVYDDFRFQFLPFLMLYELSQQKNNNKVKIKFKNYNTFENVKRR